jgi:hypothetical protein
MSDSLYVVLNKEQMKSPADWNKLLLDTQILVSISETLNSFSHSGYISCSYEGKKTGFEYELEELDLEDFSEEHRDSIRSKDSVVSFTLRDGAKSSLAASAVAAAIADLSDGILFDVDETLIQTSDALEWAKYCIHEYKIYEEKRAQAKKELRKLRKSENLVVQKLHDIVSNLEGYKPVDGMTADLSLAIILEKGKEKASISLKAWECSFNDQLIQNSKDLLDGRFADESKCQSFYDKLGDYLDDCAIVACTLTPENELHVEFSNGLFFRALPEKEIRVSVDLFSFTVDEDSVTVDVY